MEYKNEVNFNYVLKEFEDILSYKANKFAKLLKSKLMSGELELSDKFYNGYDNFKTKFAEHLLSNEKVAEYDSFRYNVLVDILVKGDLKKSRKLDNDEDFEKYVEDVVIYIINKGEELLEGLYDEGETQMFMHYDGSIQSDYVMHEKSDGIYIYAFYAYYSK